MMPVKSLVAMSIEKMLLKTSGPTFLKGIAFMYSANLSPDRIVVMQTKANKFILQFHSRCDIRPFAANYPDIKRLLRGIVHIRDWRLKSIEFLNVAFVHEDVPLIERAVEMLGVELVLLNNCTYPGIKEGDQALRLFSAFNRKKATMVCEYGDERLKALINYTAFRPSSAPPRRPSAPQAVVNPQPQAAVHAAAPQAVAAVPVAIPRPLPPPGPAVPLVAPDGVVPPPLPSIPSRGSSSGPSGLRVPATDRVTRSMRRERGSCSPSSSTSSTSSNPPSSLPSSSSSPPILSPSSGRLRIKRRSDQSEVIN